MRVPELREIAKSLGIRIPSKALKADIINAIIDYESRQVAPGSTPTPALSPPVISTPPAIPTPASTGAPKAPPIPTPKSTIPLPTSGSVPTPTPVVTPTPAVTASPKGVSRTEVPQRLNQIRESEIEPINPQATFQTRYLVPKTLVLPKAKPPPGVQMLGGKPPAPSAKPSPKLSGILKPVGTVALPPPVPGPKIPLPQGSTTMEPIPLSPVPEQVEPPLESALAVAYTPQQQALNNINNIRIEWLTPNRVRKQDTEGPNKKFYSTEEQKQIAKDLGLHVSGGTKQDLYNRIMEKLQQAGRV